MVGLDVQHNRTLGAWPRSQSKRSGWHFIGRSGCTRATRHSISEGDGATERFAR